MLRITSYWIPCVTNWNLFDTTCYKLNQICFALLMCGAIVMGYLLHDFDGLFVVQFHIGHIAQYNLIARCLMLDAWCLIHAWWFKEQDSCSWLFAKVGQARPLAMSHERCAMSLGPGSHSTKPHIFLKKPHNLLKKPHVFLKKPMFSQKNPMSSKKVRNAGVSMLFR